MSDNNLSRRDFLKLLGAGAAIAFVGKYVNLLDPAKPSFMPAASALSSGSWSLGPNLSFAAIHMALLKSGKVMYVSGSGYHVATQSGPFTGTIFNPATNAEVKQVTFNDDVFCCGFNQLENGNILVTGGTKDYDTSQPEGKWTGANCAYEFDVNTEEFYKVTSMAHGRWYPTQITLPDNKTAVFSGLDEFGDRNLLVEIYNPIFKNFSIKFDSGSSLQYCVGSTSALPGAGTPCYGGVAGKGVSPGISLYPHMILMPSGLLVRAGPERALFTWNPTNGRWLGAGTMNSTARGYGSSVLLPLNNTASERGRILLAGGMPAGTETQAKNSAEILDFNAGTDQNPTINYTASMAHGRVYANPIILPNGKVAIFGGTTNPNTDPQLIPEMFDPLTNTWSDLPAATVPRWYHSSALLLPDGRVMVASGTPTRYVFESRVEYFSPGYLDGPRPIISGSPTVGTYGGTITIPTPDASTITSVSLVRIASITHHFDNDMRLIWLQIQSNTSSSVTVSAPLNANLAPPGYYMIHILNSTGIPSSAKIIKISNPVNGGPDTTAPYVGILTPSARAVIVGPSNGVTVNVTGTAFDLPSGIQDVKVAFDSGAPTTAIPRSLGDWSAWSFSGTINTLGAHTIKAIATDIQGNKATASIPITIFFSS